jgi:hypothetical protein
MPKSKQRKGHKQKIQKRNTELKKIQAKFQKEMMEKMADLRKKYEEALLQSGDTENTNTNEMGLIQPETGTEL